MVPFFPVDSKAPSAFFKLAQKDAVSAQVLEQIHDLIKKNPQNVEVALFDTQVQEYRKPGYLLTAEDRLPLEQILEGLSRLLGRKNDEPLVI